MCWNELESGHCHMEGRSSWLVLDQFLLSGSWLSSIMKAWKWGLMDFMGFRTRHEVIIHTALWPLRVPCVREVRCDMLVEFQVASDVLCACVPLEVTRLPSPNYSCGVLSGGCCGVAHRWLPSCSGGGWGTLLAVTEVSVKDQGRKSLKYLDHSLMAVFSSSPN